MSFYKKENSTRGIGGMVELNVGKGVKQVERGWIGGGGGMVEVEKGPVEERWSGGGERKVEASQVEAKPVEMNEVEEGKGVRVVEAKLRGRILVKPREQMGMLQRVKVADHPVHFKGK